MEPAFRFVCELTELEESDGYVFDFSQLSDTPPFGMLFTATAVRRFREEVRNRRPGVQFSAVGTGNIAYASHMGFLQACGVPVGNRPGEAAGSSRYLPISNLPLADLRTEWKPIAATIADRAIELAEVLTQGASTSLETVLAYCIRELMRNTAEHSQADSVWFAAQFWPTQDRVELGILYEGRGILQSLAENPTLCLRDEEDAIRRSVELGVTRVAPTPAKSAGLWESPDYCGNSGFGLFVLRELARRTGNMLVLSNRDAVYFTERGTDAYCTAFKGTAIRLRLAPSKLGNVLDQILDALPAGLSLSKLSPSKFASLGWASLPHPPERDQ